MPIAQLLDWHAVWAKQPECVVLVISDQRYLWRILLRFCIKLSQKKTKRASRPGT